MAKANYGIDAPNVIRNLILAASAFLLLGLAFPHLRNGRSRSNFIRSFCWPAGWMCVTALLMLKLPECGASIGTASGFLRR